jgi:hypothetical protein
MSDFAGAGMVVALGIANLFLYAFRDYRVNSRADVVARTLHGFPIKHRRYVLQVRFVINVGMLIAAEGVLTVGWILVGRNASVEEFRLFAYMLASLNALAVIGWPVTAPLFYRHLAAILRQAEAD